MASQPQSIREQWPDQIYPTLEQADIERMRRFGEVRSFAAGVSVWTAGQAAPGLMVVLAGKVAVTQRDHDGNHQLLGIHDARPRARMET